MLLALSLGAALPAYASDYVHAQFSGQVLAINPDAPGSVAVDTPIDFDVVYDRDKLVDHTTTVNDATGLGFSSVLAASLSDDPNASLKITIGSISFTKFDQENYGTPRGDAGPGADLGLGDFPAVTYLDGAFAGVGNIFINSAGYSLDADPIADAFGGFDLGSGLGGYDFAVNRVVDGDPFGDPFAVGDYDASKVVFTSAAPEPASWALMMAAVAVTGATLRLARRRVPAVGAA